MTYDGLDIFRPQQTISMALSRGVARNGRAVEKTWYGTAWSHYADRSHCPLYRTSEILGWDQGKRGLFVSFQFPLFKSHTGFKAAVEFRTKDELKAGP